MAHRSFGTTPYNMGGKPHSCMPTRVTDAQVASERPTQKVAEKTNALL